MFERYTEPARRVLFFARYEASQLGSVSIEVEHVLLGLLREGKGITSRIFAGAHVSVEEVRREIEKGTIFHERISTSVEIPFTPACKRVLHCAAQEADGLNHSYIGTEHLLLGILREEHSEAAKILKAHGLSLPSVRAQVVELLKSGPLPEPPGDLRPTFEPAGGRFEVSVTHSMLPGVDTYAAHSDKGWVARGYSPKGLIAHAFDVDEGALGGTLADEGRFDCAVLVPRPAAPAVLRAIACDAIQRYFGVSVERRDRKVFITRSDSNP